MFICVPVTRYEFYTMKEKVYPLRYVSYLYTITWKQALGSHQLVLLIIACKNLVENCFPLITFLLCNILLWHLQHTVLDISIMKCHTIHNCFPCRRCTIRNLSECLFPLLGMQSASLILISWAHTTTSNIQVHNLEKSIIQAGP